MINSKLSKKSLKSRSLKLKNKRTKKSKKSKISKKNVRNMKGGALSERIRQTMINYFSNLQSIGQAPTEQTREAYDSFIKGMIRAHFAIARDPINGEDAELMKYEMDSLLNEKRNLGEAYLKYLVGLSQRPETLRTPREHSHSLRRGTPKTPRKRSQTRGTSATPRSSNNS